jgi:hypothetical protein
MDRGESRKGRKHFSNKYPNWLIDLCWILSPPEPLAGDTRSGNRSRWFGLAKINGRQPDVDLDLERDCQGSLDPSVVPSYDVTPRHDPLVLEGSKNKIPSSEDVSGISVRDRIDYICMLIGRSESWRLCHASFRVNKHGKMSDSTEKELFKALLSRLKRELYARGMQRFLFPVKLSKVEYWEVRTELWVI